VTGDVEVIEAEVTEVPQRGLVRVDAAPPAFSATGALALAALDDDEFDRRLAALTKGAERVSRIQRAIMKQDVDYGVIPGTDKPTLLKPGAEKLCLAYSLAADFRPTLEIGDGVAAPAIRYRMRCELHLGDLAGPIIAVGYGAANSWEKRYRWRRAERVCPNCGKPAVIKGKAEYGGGWLCWKKKDGCGTTWPDGSAEIEEQVTGQVENPDPWDLEVALAKIAEKRSHVDATLRATGASSLFTQDTEDVVGKGDAEPEEAAERSADGLAGIAELGKAPADFELRQTPEGAAIGFRLRLEQRRAVKVMATGPLAEQLAEVRDQVIGQSVRVWGITGSENYTPAGTKRPITYQVLALERLQAGELVLPADESDGLFSDEEQAAIDAAVMAPVAGRDA
jgi:hypothetical protein